MGRTLFDKVRDRLQGPLPRDLIGALRDVLVVRDGVTPVIAWGAVRRYIGHWNQDDVWEPLYLRVKRRYQRDGALDFGVMRLPIVAEEHGSSITSSYLDLIQPLLFPGRWCSWPTAEGTYEQYGVKVLPNDLVIDVGANFGVFSVYAAMKGARVYAFEPVPESIRILEQAIALNHCSVEVLPVALTNYSGNMNIKYWPNRLSGASAVLLEDAPVAVTVPAMTLDQWVQKHQINRIDFLKADIEGSERDLLRGAVETISRFKPKLAICTYHRSDDKQVLEQIVRKARPDYEIHHNNTKMFAK